MPAKMLFQGEDRKGIIHIKGAEIKKRKEKQRMKEFVIVTELTSDLPDEYVKEHGIKIVPLYYKFDDEIIYGDEKNLDPKEFYARMRNGEMPQTMAANPDFVRKALTEIVESGKDVLYIAFSSGLSSSADTAAMVANEMAPEYPDSKIIVVDSLCASLGQGLLVDKAVKQQAAGKSIDEIADWLEKNKLHLSHQFTVDDLFHLHRGGRVSKATAVVGTLINVKPVLHVDDEGHLIALKNVRGRKKSITSLVDNMLKEMEGYDNDTIFISHGDCYEDAQFLAQLVTEKTGITDILINYVCPTIGAHSGPGTLALFFMGEHR